MRRADVIAARDLAKKFAKECDELLATKDIRWDHNPLKRTALDWTNTWEITGKQTGAHRRLSLDLTRALAHMRRRT